MGNLSGTEILVIMFLALLLLGPDKLPEAASKIGKAIGEFKRVAGGYQTELKNAVDQVTEPIKSTMATFTTAANESLNAPAAAEPAKPGLLVPTILTPTAQLPLSEVIETTANDPVPAEVQGMPSFDNSGESDALLEDSQPRKEMPTTWLPHLMQAPAITTEAEPAAEPSTKPVVVVVPTVSTSDSISFS